MYVRFALSLRNVEDLLHERSTEISHKIVQVWWNRFISMFAAEIRLRRVDRMRSLPHWRWHGGVRCVGGHVVGSAAALALPQRYHPGGPGAITPVTKPPCHCGVASSRVNPRSMMTGAASALGLTMMLVNRGQSQSELDACVMNDAAAKQLLDNGRADFDELGVNSTPSFALDGKLLNEVHSWEDLYPVLSTKFSAAPG